MRLIILLMLGVVVTYATYVWAKTEDPTSLVMPISLYGTTSGGTIVPILVAADGTLQTQ